MVKIDPHMHTTHIPTFPRKDFFLKNEQQIVFVRHALAMAKQNHSTSGRAGDQAFFFSG
jgi:hypothetical protein